MQIPNVSHSDNNPQASRERHILNPHDLRNERTLQARVHILRSAEDPRRFTRRTFAKMAFAAACCLSAPMLLSSCAGNSENSTSASNGSESAEEATYSSNGAVQNSASEDVQTRTLFLFDTIVQLSAQCPPDVMDKLAERCAYFESKFSRTKEGSDIWNVNHAAGAPVQVCDETAQIIGGAIEYSRASDGLFDITIGTVSSLWDFVEGIKPDDEAIRQALPHIGYGKISLEGNTVTLADCETMLDLGAIAKGFIADDLVSMLREAKCDNASLSLGGNVYVMGQSYDGDAWNVGVQDPNGNVEDIVASIEASNASLVTSGLYERCFEEKGTLYHHILDPKTGYPVQTDLASASIKSESSIDGDAYSTILFLLGRDAALDLVDSDERFEALLIDVNGNLTASADSNFEIIEGE